VKDQKNPEPEFVVCESVAAITTHFRQLGDDVPPINLSGFAKRPKALCGTEIGWDTQLPASSVRCAWCLEHRRAIERTRSR
jgi:hypothetical protein